MSAIAYYNEIDPFAAEWLRCLIDAGHIAPGVVDTRSIEDVRPSDLRGFSQCHFFAGVGVWSYALRLAGWPDNRPIWTASCPCQPFSASGRRSGFDDERHLWPRLHWLIEKHGPPVVVGEQVASKAAEPWVDLVQTDLEALGYAFGCVAFPSAGVGAPMLRDRAYWVAHAERSRPEDRAEEKLSGARRRSERREPGQPGAAGLRGVEDPGSQRRDGEQIQLQSGRPRQAGFETAGRSGDSRLAYTSNSRRERRRSSETGNGRDSARVESERLCPADRRPGPTNGRWAAADWLHCRDGKWRPVEPGTFPLANGAPARVGRLRGYGNAINAEAARAFIECVM